MESINLTNTLAGLAAIQRAMAGEDILFTKLEIGDGVLTDTDVSKMTGLINKTKDYVLGAVDAEDSEIVRLRSNLSNDGVTQDLIIREYGIYAKFGEEQEFLFAYLNTGNVTTPLPSERIGRYELNRDFVLYIGNSLHVDFTSNGHLIYVSVNQYKDDMKGKANVIRSICELKLSNKYKSGDIIKVLENGLVFEIKDISNVGFEDELHFRLANGVYANLDLDASDLSWIIKRQNELVAKYLDLNARNEQVIITLQGDSITYGHDTNSADKVGPPTNTLPDGSKHSATRSPRPINVSLQENLREIYGRDNIFVENRGYSGDWANRSYTKWRTPNGSNITLFLLGQNDQGGSWVPEAQRTYEAFYHWNLMLGIREVLRGACVVFTDGYNNNSNNGGDRRATFMEMNSKIAETMGALFLETSTMLYGCNTSFFSDSVHLNTKGNDRMGARLVPFFVNKQMIDPVKINPNDYLGINTDFTQVRRTNGAILTSASGSAGIITGAGGTEPVYVREIATLNSDERAIYSTFYLDGKSTVLNILGGFIGVEVEIDFGNEQAYVEDDYTLGSSRFDEYNPLPPSFYEAASCEIPSTGTQQATRIPILGKGWHTVRIRKQQGREGDLYVNGLKFIDRNELSTMYIDINDFKLDGEEKNFDFASSDNYNIKKTAAGEILKKLGVGRIYGRDKIIGKINKINNYEVTRYGSGASINGAVCLTIRDSNYERGDMKFYFTYNSGTYNYTFKKLFDSSNDKIFVNSSFDTDALTNALQDNLDEILPKRCITLVFNSGGGQVQVYTYGTAIGSTAKTAIACYRFGQSFDGIIESRNYTHQSGVVTFVDMRKIIPTTTLQAIDTPYYTLKMQQEGIYQEYITYRDELHEYNYQQREIEKQKQLAYEEVLKENPNLTYEEFLENLPMLLPVLEKPQPSEALIVFKEKYLG